jgi:ubiquinone/menaquinone biosynthesis C-methylase UbiE
MLEAFPREILDRLRCPSCRKGDMKVDTSALVCTGCSKTYLIKDGIIDFDTGDSSLRMPRIYNDPDYLKWGSMYADSYDYFYETKGPVSYVQNSGHRHIKAMTDKKKYNLILDIGCGNGAHFPYVSTARHCVGLDYNMDFLKKVHQRYPEHAIIRADAYTLPFAEGTIDCIVNIYNLEHMVYLDLALEEMMRIVTDDGDIFVSVPNEGGLLWTLGRELSSVRNFTTQDFNYSRAVQIEHINCIWQIEKALKRYFTIKKKMRFPFPIPSFHANLVTTYHCKKM